MIALLSWLLDATIKGSLLILLVAVVYRVIGSRLDARWRHLLWVIVLVRLAMPAAPASDWSLFNLLSAPQTERQMRRSVAVAPIPVVEAGDDSLMRLRHLLLRERGSRMPVGWIFTIWISGVICFAFRMLFASVRMGRAVGRARPLEIRSPIPIVECDAVRTPALHGLLRPRILLPPGLATSFTPAELRHVVLHELWHRRRLDVAVSWMLSTALALHWFNPLVWFAASRIKEERELACDELSLSCLEEEERSGYGMTILKLLERFRAPAPIPALIGIVNQKNKMKRRLTMIASFRSRERFTTLLFLTIAAVATLGLTDARGGMHRVIKEIDPAARVTIERLEQRISFEVSNVTLSELLTEVANQTGVAVTQAPELATLPVQQARFTLKAEQVPAHLVLMEALMPFQLAPHPNASDVTIIQGVHAIEEVEGPGTFEKKVVITNGSPEESDRVIKVLEGEQVEGRIDERVFVRRMAPDMKPDADGRIRRELKLKMDQNGVKTEGKLTIDIATK